MAKRKSDDESSLSPQKDRIMLPREYAMEKKISSVIIAGAFVDQTDELITESEFDEKLKNFLDKKSTN